MDILEILKEAKDDPFWAEHSEVSKNNLGRAIDEIERLRTELSELRTKAEVQAAKRPAKQRFDECGATEECDPIERLRFFCSLAMSTQDWLDVEPFFDELRAQAADVPDDEFPHDEMDAIALRRFKVEQTGSNIWGWCVRAGDGTQELYKGRKSDCEAVARRLIGAFLDGAMLAHDMLAAAPSPTGLDNSEAPKS